MCTCEIESQRVWVSYHTGSTAQLDGATSWVSGPNRWANTSASSGLFSLSFWCSQLFLALVALIWPEKWQVSMWVYLLSDGTRGAKHYFRKDRRLQNEQTVLVRFRDIILWGKFFSFFSPTNRHKLDIKTQLGSKVWCLCLTFHFLKC